jgi:inosose dehydratase
MTSYARLRLGTAPDSWGIWFPNDSKQPHWSTFLDEVVESGFRTIDWARSAICPPIPNS